MNYEIEEIPDPPENAESSSDTDTDTDADTGSGGGSEDHSEESNADSPPVDITEKPADESDDSDGDA